LALQHHRRSVLGELLCDRLKEQQVQKCPFRLGTYFLGFVLLFGSPICDILKEMELIKRDERQF
jgi:hypothetical protein